MIIIEGDQQSDEWVKIRAGIPTASRFSEIITPKTMNLSKSADGYMKELAAARLWGVYEESFQSVHMTNGIAREDEARSAYEAYTVQEVQRVRFVYKDERMDRGCSPDGLTSLAVIEIKSPKLKNHIHYMLSGQGPEEYKCQIQGEIDICEKDHGEFVSFFPGAPLHIQRVPRDDEFIKRMNEAIDQFNIELDKLVETLRSK